jgi:hypothetical protein
MAVSGKMNVSRACACPDNIDENLGFGKIVGNVNSKNPSTIVVKNIR